MHFDDRLATVLRQRATGGAIARIQYRQLIDLLSSRDASASDDATIDLAFEHLGDLGASIPSAERAAILREPMMRLGNAELVACLARDEPDVASAAIAATDITEEEWITLIPALPIRARGILRHRRDLLPKVNQLLEQLGIGDRGLPPAAAAVERPARPELVVLEGGVSTPHPASRAEPGLAGIGAIVRQIEAFRAARSAPSDSDEANAAPAPSGSPGARLRPSLLALDFTTDAEARVDWADGPLASGLVGASLGADDEATAALKQALRHRQPLRAIPMEFAGAPDFAGSWRLDAMPRFAAPDGRFIGYTGRLRRTLDATRPQKTDNPADTMRQILHELRTPATAIQIAAEIIQQQLYGATPHEYRALAAAIAGDTAQILAGFDELDRLVKLESGTLSPEAGECDLARLVAETVERLRAWTDPCRSAFTLPEMLGPIFVRLDREEAARMIWRLLAGLAGASDSGETIELAFDLAPASAILTIAIPAALADRIDQPRIAKSGAGPARALSAGMFGIGFTLRLAKAEATAAGGSLERDRARLCLTLPRLTPATASHSQA